MDHFTATHYILCKKNYDILCLLYFSMDQIDVYPGSVLSSSDGRLLTKPPDTDERHQK